MFGVDSWSETPNEQLKLECPLILYMFSGSETNYDHGVEYVIGTEEIFQLFNQKCVIYCGNENSYALRRCGYQCRCDC